jgi:hypothetical protein
MDARFVVMMGVQQTSAAASRTVALLLAGLRRTIDTSAAAAAQARRMGMGMTFELWDTESGNLLDSYPSIEAALAFVRSVIGRYGTAVVAQWELLAMEDGVSATSVAVGETLATLAPDSTSTPAL